MKIFTTLLSLLFLLAVSTICINTVSAAESVYQRMMIKAIKDNDLKTAQDMLKQGASVPNLKNYELVQKPFHIVKFLLDNGHKVVDGKDVISNIYYDLFSYETISDRDQKVKLFIDKKIPILFADDHKRTILYYITQRYLDNYKKGDSKLQEQRTKAYQYFLGQAKAYLNTPSWNHNPVVPRYETPIYLTLGYSTAGGAGWHSGKLDAAKMLVKAGYNLNLCSDDRATIALPPLQHAVYYAEMPFVQYFLEQKADINLVCEGKTALDVIRGKNSTKQADIDMELFLMKRGAKPASELKATPSAKSASELKATAGVKSASAATVRTNSIGMEFVQIPAGSFMMGSGNGESDEKPSHHVTISKPFYLGKYEVTQEQWMAVMGSNPSKFKNGQKPVEMVNWNDAQEFIKRLNKKEGHNRYRLPSEAEWEYAARAGTTTDYSIGAGLLENYAVYESADSRSGPKLVGQKKANPWGLYDMHGNIGEWVQDLYGKDYYASSSDNDPRGPASGSNRVIRGGNWYLYAKNSRSAARLGETPVLKNEFIGFRLALDPE